MESACSQDLIARPDFFAADEQLLLTIAVTHKRHLSTEQV
jgi:hypothetical protein